MKTNIKIAAAVFVSHLYQCCLISRGDQCRSLHPVESARDETHHQSHDTRRAWRAATLFQRGVNLGDYLGSFAALFRPGRNRKSATEIAQMKREGDSDHVRVQRSAGIITRGYPHRISRSRRKFSAAWISSSPTHLPMNWR